MPTWWPALVFGWPGPILAIIFAVNGLVRGKAAWLVAAAVVALPFSFYLVLNPGGQWGVLLPVLPLIGARAVSRGAKPTALVSVLLLAAVILGFAGVVITQPRPY
jgi:hypothetical protein